jgi:hypothetical protein
MAPIYVRLAGLRPIGRDGRGTRPGIVRRHAPQGPLRRGTPGVLMLHNPDPGLLSLEAREFGPSGAVLGTQVDRLVGAANPVNVVAEADCPRGCR